MTVEKTSRHFFKVSPFNAHRLEKPLANFTNQLLFGINGHIQMQIEHWILCRLCTPPGSML